LPTRSIAPHPAAGVVLERLRAIEAARGKRSDTRDAIGAVMTPEPWRIPMRRLSPLLVLLFVTPAHRSRRSNSG